MCVHAAAPVALALGVPVFLFTTGIDRGAGGASFAESSHYQDIVAALLLPALALAVDAILRESRAWGVVALAVLVAGIPGNIAVASRVAHDEEALTRGLRHTLLSVPRDPLAANVPPALRPDPNFSRLVTLGWLRAGVRSGRVPPTRSSNPREISANRLRLSLMELDHASGFPCHPLRQPIVVRLAQGDSVGIRGSVAVTLLATPTAPESPPLPFGYALINQSVAHTLVAVAGPLAILIRPATALEVEQFGGLGKGTFIAKNVAQFENERLSSAPATALCQRP